ncbi:MAG: hypothetical protein HY056_04595 [Proteobacteria bacterium]|nr:hypothetical protein [Pseudomonadota bacterium]
MAGGNEPELFDGEGQAELFGAEATPGYRADPDKVRTRLHRILAQARAALQRTIFPQMTLFPPREEDVQLRFAFDAEIARPEAA